MSNPNEIKQFPVAVLSVSLDTQCPKCDHDFDLLDDDDGMYSNFIFNDKFDELHGETAFCPNCGFEFLIGDIIY